MFLYTLILLELKKNKMMLKIFQQQKFCKWLEAIYCYISQKSNIKKHKQQVLKVKQQTENLWSDQEQVFNWLFI